MGATNLAAYQFLNQMIQSSEQGNSKEAEKLLKQALDADPENMDALRHAAGFYHFVMRDVAKARHYAVLCRAQAMKVSAQMDDILGQGREKTKSPASRNIGGIIGPY